MRTIEWTRAFKRDYKRETRSQYGRSLDAELDAIVPLLSSDQAPAERYRDHALTGNWQDHRECHIKPDLLLIYRKPDQTRLQLVRLGSHSALGL